MSLSDSTCHHGFENRNEDNSEQDQTKTSHKLLHALALRTVGIEKFQVTTIDRYSKLNRHFSFGECLPFFFQKAVDFFNRIVYNKIVRYLSLYKSSLTEENIYG